MKITKQIRLDQLIPEEFAVALKTLGRIEVKNIGTFYITRYTKKLHPIMIGGQRTKSMTNAYVKDREVVYINFKPCPSLKRAISGV